MKYLSEAITFAENGEPDPFSATIEAICEIMRYDYYVVPQHMQGNLQAIARKLYQNPHMYWVLQFYNGVCYPHEVTAGLKLKVPYRMDVEYILGQQLNSISTDEVYI